jgi:hypothetical protein
MHSFSSLVIGAVGIVATFVHPIPIIHSQQRTFRAPAPILTTHDAQDIDRIAASLAPSGSPLLGEGLTGNKVRVAEHCYPRAGGQDTFTASGTVSGPYPGTFSANGSWIWGPPHIPTWGFGESFTISSGKYTVTGAINGRGAGPPVPAGCYGFGPASMPYTATVTAHGKVVKKLSGIATVFGIHNGYLSELLQ